MGSNPDNLFQRKNIWYLRYSVKGRKIVKSLRTKSLREAKRQRDQILGHRSIAAQLGIEPPQPRQDPLFSEIAERFLASRRADGSLSESTLKNYDCRMRLWILPYFQTFRMSAITVDDIESFIGHLRVAEKPAGGTLSDNYILSIFSVLRTMYRKAVKRQWYKGINPLEQLERLPSKGPGRKVSLTEPEACALLDELSGMLYYKVGLALQTGLRWGELHGLEWEGDIELNTHPATLTVRRSFRGPPKNKASAATNPLSSSAASLLRRWRQEQGLDARYVFPNRNGEIRAYRATQDVEQIHEAAARAGITKHVHPHLFRHTFGTWVYQRTRDPKIVQRLMRHADFKTSMQYVHDSRDLGEVVNQLPNLTSATLHAVV